MKIDFDYEIQRSIYRRRRRVKILLVIGLILLAWGVKILVGGRKQ